jgi:hypothetical protein
MVACDPAMLIPHLRKRVAALQVTPATHASFAPASFSRSLAPPGVAMEGEPVAIDRNYAIVFVRLFCCRPYAVSELT